MEEGLGGIESAGRRQGGEGTMTDREAIILEWQRLRYLASPECPYKIPEEDKAEADKCASLCIQELYARGGDDE
jgi:hypothetical protein